MTWSRNSNINKFTKDKITKDNQFYSNYELGERTKEVLKKSTKVQRITNLIASIILTLIILGILCLLVKITWKTNSNLSKFQKLKNHKIKSEKINGYKLALQTGIIEMEKGNLMAAREEFLMARKISPNQVYHNVELANLYLAFCIRDNIHCEETSEFISEVNKKFAGNKYLANIKTKYN